MWASWPLLLLGVLAHLLRSVACVPSLGYSLSAFAWKTSPRVSCLISDVSLLREALRALSFLCPALFSSVIGPPDISVLVCSRGSPHEKVACGLGLGCVFVVPSVSAEWLACRRRSFVGALSGWSGSLTEHLNKRALSLLIQPLLRLECGLRKRISPPFLCKDWWSFTNFTMLHYA